MIAADVQSLRKGLDLAKAEKEKQQRNFIIYVSFQAYVGIFSWK